jgi:hypothetical protein
MVLLSIFANTFFSLVEMEDRGFIFKDSIATGDHNALYFLGEEKTFFFILWCIFG